MAKRLCDACGVRPATVALRRAVPGEPPRVEHLCDIHAAEAGGGRSPLGGRMLPRPNRRYDAGGPNPEPEGIKKTVPEEQVRHVANLARLGLTDEEVEKMSEQLGAILDSIEEIRELDLEDVPPTASLLDPTNVLRPDEPQGELSQQEALAPAPETVDGFFAVPKVD